MKCVCKLLKVDKDFEDGIILEYNGFSVECFLSYSPFTLKEGQYYEVCFEFQNFNDEILIRKAELTSVNLTKTNHAFSYNCIGILKGNTILSSIPITDDYFVNIIEMQNKMVEIVIERLDVLIIAEF